MAIILQFSNSSTSTLFAVYPSSMAHEMTSSSAETPTNDFAISGARENKVSTRVGIRKTAKRKSEVIKDHNLKRALSILSK